MANWSEKPKPRRFRREACDCPQCRLRTDNTFWGIVASSYEPPELTKFFTDPQQALELIELLAVGERNET